MPEYQAYSYEMPHFFRSYHNLRIQGEGGETSGVKCVLLIRCGENIKAYYCFGVSGEMKSANWVG